MRIAIGQVLHETNTFSSERTDEEAFRRQEWCEGEQIFSEHKGVRDYVGGMMDEAAEREGIVLVPTLAVSAEPSGIITYDAWQSIKTHLLENLRQLPDIDGICLALHGAGIAEQCDDIEGELLRNIRGLVGPKMHVVVTLDLHANMTFQMVEHADLLLGVNYYPHLDEYDRGREAIRLMHEMQSGRIAPVMHLVKLPMMMPTCHTLSGPTAAINEVCWNWEGHPDMIDCTFFHGFPYSDRSDTAVAVLAIANGKAALAQEAAEHTAQCIWERRETFYPPFMTAEEGMSEALRAEERPVLINETSDNPGAGAPGDGTFLLREMLQRNEPDTCFCHICDPEIVVLAHQVGVGGEIRGLLGGKTDQWHGDPIPVTAEVVKLTNGVFTQTSPMWCGKSIDLGPSVRLRIGKVDVIVTSIKSQLLDDELLKLHDINLNQCRVLGIKSSQHFRGFFQEKVYKILTVDTSGISSFHFRHFPYEHIQRPIYPLDDVASKESNIVD